MCRKSGFSACLRQPGLPDPAIRRPWRGRGASGRARRAQMVTQCKTAQNAFGEGNAAAEAQSAGVEYGKRFGGKCRAVLAVNLPSVQEKVRDRAKTLNVEIWDRPILERLLNKRRTLYRDLGDLLAQPRLERVVGAAVGSAHADLEAEAQKMSDCWENVRRRTRLDELMTVPPNRTAPSPIRPIRLWHVAMSSPAASSTAHRQSPSRPVAPCSRPSSGSRRRARPSGCSAVPAPSA